MSCLRTFHYSPKPCKHPRTQCRSAMQGMYNLKRSERNLCEAYFPSIRNAPELRAHDVNVQCNAIYPVLSVCPSVVKPLLQQLVPHSLDFMLLPVRGPGFVFRVVSELHFVQGIHVKTTTLSFSGCSSPPSLSSHRPSPLRFK